MANLWDKRTLGRTGITTSRLGIGSSFGLEAADLEVARERGVTYFYWGSIRRSGYGQGIRAIAKTKREELTIVVQSYSRAAFYVRPSLEGALEKLGLDYADVLLLGWWNTPPPRRILDAALALREAGKVKHIMISCHHRPTFEKFIPRPEYGAIMVRYNAAHPGAEREVFPHLDEAGARPGVVAYTATRWGALLRPELTPAGEATPRASDCYRFALTNPNVDVVLCGPKDRSELDEAMSALDRGPMSDDEIAWMKRVGKSVHATSASKSGNLPMQLIDKVMGIGGEG